MNNENHREFFQALAGEISKQIADHRPKEDYDPRKIPDTPEKWLWLRELRERGMQDYMPPARYRDYPESIQELAKAIGIEDALWIAMNMETREQKGSNPNSPDSTKEHPRLYIPKILASDHWLTVALGEDKAANVVRALGGKRLELPANPMLTKRNDYRKETIRIAEKEGKSAEEIAAIPLVDLGGKQTNNVISKINSADEIDLKLEITLRDRIIESIKNNDPQAGEFMPETIAIIKNNGPIVIKFMGDIYENTAGYPTHKIIKIARGN